MNGWSQRRFRLTLGAIAFGAFVVRLVYMLIVRHYELAGDQPYYHQQSDFLADGVGFHTGPGADSGPAATHPPLTTIVLSIASRLASGNSIFEQRLTTVLLGVATVAVIGLIARDLAGPRAGLLAAGIAAITPTLWTYDGQLLSESLAGLLIAASLWCAYKYLREPHVKWAALLGLACGLAMLTRGELMFLALCVVVPVIVVGTRGAIWPRVGRVAIAGLAALVVVGPWVGYNLSRFEKPVYLSTSIGGAICGSNNPEAYSGPKIGLWAPSPEACPLPKQPNVDSSVIAHKWSDAGFEYLKHHVGDVPVAVLARLGRVWGVFRPGNTVQYLIDESLPSGSSWAGYAAYWLIVPFALWGLWLLRKRGTAIFPMVGLFVVTSLASASFYGLIRLRLSSDIAFVVLAGIALDHLWNTRTASTTPAEDNEHVEGSPAAPPA
jgi:4-amino-4-deoxy-L-arabinose transferase-like glycosyltransferase